MVRKLVRRRLLPIHCRKGRYILELSLTGYQTRSLEVEINQGSLNNLGLVPLVHDVGQLSIKSEPGTLAFEIVDSEQKTTFGNTPMTVDNLPTGKYTVRIKRSGWPDFVQEIDLQTERDGRGGAHFQGCERNAEE